jgi:hypothetical protein
MSILKITAFCTLLTSVSFAGYHGHDGQYNKAEMKKAFEESFSMADKEKNGSLTLAEFKVFHAEMNKKREANKPSEEEMFKEIDTDSSGGVTSEEMKNHWKNRKDNDNKKHKKHEDDKSEKSERKDRKDKK